MLNAYTMHGYEGIQNNDTVGSTLQSSGLYETQGTTQSYFVAL